MYHFSRRLQQIRRLRRNGLYRMSRLTEIRNTGKYSQYRNDVLHQVQLSKLVTIITTAICPIHGACSGLPAIQPRHNGGQSV